MTSDKRTLISATMSLADDDFMTGKNWQVYHDLYQMNEGQQTYDLVHGLVHLIEGDLSNAAYWFQRAGVNQFSKDVEAEWKHTLDRLNAERE